MDWSGRSELLAYGQLLIRCNFFPFCSRFFWNGMPMFSLNPEEQNHWSLKGAQRDHYFKRINEISKMTEGQKTFLIRIKEEKWIKVSMTKYLKAYEYMLCFMQQGLGHAICEAAIWNSLITISNNNFDNTFLNYWILCLIILFRHFTKMIINCLSIDEVQSLQIALIIWIPQITMG